ncbi:plasminogen [Bicyclus anynana]|uniref:Plasminogen n=1 Tax=Bicyclus anynana TaxID=110368 RepID=A0A6J1MYN0_BICAN|nr:plasminogen [Bicyclus anynana]
MSPLALALVWLQLARGDSAWAPLEGLPLACAHPCRHSRAVALWMEPGLPPARTMRFYVHVDTHIPANSVMNVTFDSAVNIILTIRLHSDEFQKFKMSPSVMECCWEAGCSEVTVYNELSQNKPSFYSILLYVSRDTLTNGDSFELRFDKELSGLSFIVEGSAPGLTPLTGLAINDKEFCEEPDVGYLRKYLAGKGVLDKREYPWKAVIRKSNTNCGKAHVDGTRVIENGPAQPGAWPWHAGIHVLSKHPPVGYKYICGGTLISNYFVLTAAHCVVAWFGGTAMAPEKLQVVLGQHNLNVKEHHSQKMKVEKVIIHERYNYKRRFANIALLKLSSAASFTSFVQPACLWRSGVHSRGTASALGVVAGWGFDNDDTLPGSLQQVLLPIVSAETCRQSYPAYYSLALNRGSFCAGYHNNGTGVCNGDSGGGLVVNVPNETESGSGEVSGSWYVRGIVSNAPPLPDRLTCDPDHYSVFTDVDKYTDWIDGQMDA